MKKYYFRIFLSNLLIIVFLAACGNSSTTEINQIGTSTPSGISLDTERTSDLDVQFTHTPSVSPSPTLLPTPYATPLGSGGGLLTYAADRNGIFNIYTISLDSKEINQITLTGEYVENPYWSPDGRSIIFTGEVYSDDSSTQDQIFVIDYEMQQINQITDESENITPFWSPFGEEIGFLSSRDGSWAIYTMNLDSSSLTKHTDGLGFIDQPYWSPDGGSVILADRESIIADSEIIKIEFGKFGYENISQNNADDFDPSWSPDGSRIAFVSNRDGNSEIYVMDADGSNQTRVTFSDGRESLPRWSPDGTRIAFHANVDGNFDLYMINADGSNLLRLTDDPAQDVSPIWSPDGNVIAFVSLRDDTDWQECTNTRTCNSNIYLINIVSGELIKLTDNPKADISPNWQPATD